MLASILFQIVAYIIAAAQCVDFAAHFLTNRAILNCLSNLPLLLSQLARAALGM